MNNSSMIDTLKNSKLARAKTNPARRRHTTFRSYGFPTTCFSFRFHPTTHDSEQMFGTFRGGCAEEQFPRNTKCFSTGSTFFFCLHARFSSGFVAVGKFKIKLFCLDLRRFSRKIFLRIFCKSIFNFFESTLFWMPKVSCGNGKICWMVKL